MNAADEQSDRSMQAGASRSSAWTRARTAPMYRLAEGGGRVGAGRSVMFVVSPDTVGLIAVVEGVAQLTGNGAKLVVSAGNAAVLARSGETCVTWSAGSRGVAVQAPRQPLQVRVGRVLDLPLRFAGTDRILAVPPGSTLAAALQDGACAIEDGLAELLTRQADQSGLLRVARSVKRAIDHVRAHSEIDLDADLLAAIAGVTPRTLRDGFRACLGVSLTQFVQDTRLAAARTQLSSGRDSRTLAEVARAAGFAKPSSFSRAYNRAFGETPTTTRKNSIVK